MPLDNYDPSTALSAYYPTRDERRPARLWATEKLLHDMAELGMVEFFEGPGTDPTALSGYSVDKVWLQVSSGITAQPGTVRAYDGSGDASDIANWPELTTGAMARMFGAALQTDVDDLRLNGDVFVANVAALKALDTGEHGAAFLRSSEQPYLWQTGDYSAEITASDPRYIKSDAVDADEGAWVMAGSVETGDFDANVDDPRIHRLADRVFIGGAAGFNGWYAGYDYLLGLSDLTRALHGWGPRDSTLLVDSTAGALSIVGMSQSSKATGWPGSPTYTPSSIGVAGFAINDATNGQGWGGYFDSVGFTGSNFTVGVEVTHANFKSNSVLTPFNYLSGGANAGAVQWIASGCGLELVESDLAKASLHPWDVNSAAAYTVYLSSYATAADGTWATTTAYSVGDLLIDPQTDVVYRCMVSHTSGGGGFYADRAANPTYWKPRPGAAKGIVFTAGSVTENTYGSNLFSAITMPERYVLEWGRLNGSSAYEATALIYADNVPDGSDAVSMIFGEEKVLFYIGSTVAVNVDSGGVNLPATGAIGWDSDAFRWAHGSGALSLYAGGTAYFSVNSVGVLSLSNLAYYADDTAAASGGVPIYGVYRSGGGGDLKVRVT